MTGARRSFHFAPAGQRQPFASQHTLGQGGQFTVNRAAAREILFDVTAVGRDDSGALDRVVVIMQDMTIAQNRVGSVDRHDGFVRRGRQAACPL